MHRKLRKQLETTQSMVFFWCGQEILFDTDLMMLLFGARGLCDISKVEERYGFLNGVHRAGVSHHYIQFKVNL